MNDGKKNYDINNDNKEKKIYSLADMYGKGELISWMKYAANTGDHSFINECIESKVSDFMYNNGKGKVMAISELVKIRNQERNAMLGAFRKKKNKGKSGPNILNDFNQEGGQNQGDLKKALKLLDGGKGGKGDHKYREIVWKLDERGTMGENLLGTCLMQGSPIHMNIAIKLVQQYPGLVNDIFISEDYYGLSALHQAIVNEDSYMTGFLLQNGADVNARCYGAFFCADDQKSGRTDSLEHEYVDLPSKTNYTGRMYFGEYPLSFAACTGQVDCYRLLRAKKADPNLKDTNGNTVLHMTVIHEKLDMLKLAYETGAKLQITNNQNLTPLTLAAKLGKKKMFEELLKLERQMIWCYGSSNCYSYPLSNIDTVDQETGNINNDCALSLVVYGDTPEHLNLIDGLIEDLLEAKWKVFGRRQLLRSFCAFSIYYLFFFMAFMNRPFSLTTAVITDGSIIPIMAKGQSYLNYFKKNDSQMENFINYSSNNNLNYVDFYESKYFRGGQCHLWNYDIPQGFGYIRLVSEIIVVMSVILQIVLEIKDFLHMGKRRWWQILKAFPAKLAYKCSWILIILMIPVRLLCGLHVYMLVFENVLSIITILFTTIHFLFYCRSIKFVGPFVLMIYTIIAQDMFRFVAIYFIFLLGFSQAFYLIFLSCERYDKLYYNGTVFNNIVADPLESIQRLFIMTVGEFMLFYKTLNSCPVRTMNVIGKVLFLIFEIGVSLTQFNLLIAMLTRTYESIANTRKEYKRQWAQVILALETSLSPQERLLAMFKYSKPIGTNKKKRAFVLNSKNKSSSDDIRAEKEMKAELLIEEKRNKIKKHFKEGTSAFIKKINSKTLINDISKKKEFPVSF
ncbi:Nanchung [Strongyloides ratti]|uniref:Nanchung n=1 Tax=Strongyloides ratti TaxID=34506 RepID=A0A090LQL7_STRRB|nr:Nanchung [Strongyloides ratti]CEF69866.1 Nanchung [Strongyloides ratti]